MSKPLAIMTNAELDEIADEVLAMEAFCKAYRDLVQTKLEQGETFNQAQLTPKRPHTKWVDKAAALRLLAKARILSRDVFEPRSIMPPGEFRKQMAEELKKEKVKPSVKAIADLIHTGSSGYNLTLTERKKRKDAECKS